MENQNQSVESPMALDPRFQDFVASPTVASMASGPKEYVRVHFRKFGLEEPKDNFFALEYFTECDNANQAKMREFAQSIGVLTKGLDVEVPNYDYRTAPYWGRPYERVNPEVTYRLEVDYATREARYKVNFPTAPAQTAPQATPKSSLPQAEPKPIAPSEQKLIDVDEQAAPKKR